MKEIHHFFLLYYFYDKSLHFFLSLNLGMQQEMWEKYVILWTKQVKYNLFRHFHLSMTSLGLVYLFSYTM